MNASSDKRTREELERNFVQAYERLLRAGEAFDRGHRSEAPNIAKEVYNFVHDVGKTPECLLSHLGLKNIQFASTSQKANFDAQAGAGWVLASPQYLLIDATIGFDGMDYVPIFGRKGVSGWMPFEAWYVEPVLTWPGREAVRRRDLIEFLRHTQGGGHVAGKYEQRWAELSALVNGDWIDGHIHLNNGPPLKPENEGPAFATARQIGWELEETLRRGVSELVGRANLQPVPGPRMTRV